MRNVPMLLMSLATVLAATALEKREALSQENAPVGHMVFFKLKESTPATRKQLVDACHKYLSGHEGTLYFSVGVLAEDFNREVNDRDFDVALHLVFANKAAHDKYQEHPRHIQFIQENRQLWSKVRVFDSYLQTK